MCKGISILKAKIRQELFEEYQLEERQRHRGDSDHAELHFQVGDKLCQMPVEYAGELVIMEWGNRGGKTPKLPKTMWCREESLKAGKWRWLSPEPVIVPADFGLEKGVWFPIEQGLRGVVVNDGEQRPHVYLLTQEASHYYQTMTKHDRMPLLIDQEI